MRSLFLAVVFVAMLVGSTTIARGALILNGSFEDPIVPVGSFRTLGVGSTAITGWEVVGVNTALVSGAFLDTGILYQAQDGNQWLDLTGPGTNSAANGVTQNVTTTIGQAYSLNFYVGSATNGSTIFASTVDLSINGGPRVSYTNPNTPSNVLDWISFSANFTATSTTTNITFYNGSAPNNHLSGLDNVSLSAVPEPSALAIWGMGVIGMAVYGWRRRRKVA